MNCKYLITPLFLFFYAIAVLAQPDLILVDYGPDEGKAYKNQPLVFLIEFANIKAESAMAHSQSDQAYKNFLKEQLDSGTLTDSLYREELKTISKENSNSGYQLTVSPSTLRDLFWQVAEPGNKWRSPEDKLMFSSFPEKEILLDGTDRFTQFIGLPANALEPFDGKINLRIGFLARQIKGKHEQDTIWSNPVNMEIMSGRLADHTNWPIREQLHLLHYHFIAGSYNEALTIADLILSNNPENTTANYFKAKIRYTQGDLQGALDLLSPIVEATNAEQDIHKHPHAILALYEEIMTKIIEE